MLVSQTGGEFQKKRMICYNADGTKAVIHNFMVTPFSGDIYRSECIKDDNCNYEHCILYLWIPEKEIGVEIGRVAADNGVDESMESVRRAHMESVEAFMEKIRVCIAAGAHVQLTEIKLVELLDASLVPACWEARKLYAEKLRARYQAGKERREAEEAAFVKEQNEEAEKLVVQAVETIKNGGRLVNRDVEFYKSRWDSSTYSIINYLARVYGVKIPIKTQGWINSSLAEIEIKNGKMSGGRMRGKNQSSVIYDYMNELIAAVLAG